MKAFKVLQGIKRSVNEKGYVDFNVYDKAESVYSDDDLSTRYHFGDGSILSFCSNEKTYTAFSVYLDNNQHEIFQA